MPNSGGTPAVAAGTVIELTLGQFADHAIITVGVLSADVVQEAATIVGRYSLEEINQGYQDLDDGKLIRGIIVH